MTDNRSGCFVVAHREGQTDYTSSVVGRDSADGVVQIEMLDAHVRTVLESPPLEMAELVAKALAIDDTEADDARKWWSR